MEVFLFLLDFLSFFLSLYFSVKAIQLCLGTNMISWDIKENASKLSIMKSILNFSVPYFCPTASLSLLPNTLKCPTVPGHLLPDPSILRTATIQLGQPGSRFPEDFTNSSKSNLCKFMLTCLSVCCSHYHTNLCSLPVIDSQVLERRSSNLLLFEALVPGTVQSRWKVQCTFEEVWETGMSLSYSAST